MDKRIKLKDKKFADEIYEYIKDLSKEQQHDIRVMIIAAKILAKSETI